MIDVARAKRETKKNKKSCPVLSSARIKLPSFSDISSILSKSGSYKSIGETDALRRLERTSGKLGLYIVALLFFINSRQAKPKVPEKLLYTQARVYGAVPATDRPG